MAAWGMRRSYDHRDYPPLRVLGAKRGRLVSVCLPARNEAGTIGQTVGLIRRELMDLHPIVDELIVIDDGSSDATAGVAAEAGARVVEAKGVLSAYGVEHGKGQAMWKGLHISSGDVVVFCDADIREFHAGFVLGLVGPLLSRRRGICESVLRASPGRPARRGRSGHRAHRPAADLGFLSSFERPVPAPFRGIRGPSGRPGNGPVRRRVRGRPGPAGGRDGPVRERLAGPVRSRRASASQPFPRRARPSGSRRAPSRPAAGRGGGRSHSRGRPDPGWTTELLRPGVEAAAVTLVERPPLVEVPGHLKTA